MKVILDEGVPKRVAGMLFNHDVVTVPDAGWASVKNGKLLALIEQAGYEAFITCDKNMELQQPVHLRPFAILVLSTNHWPSIRLNVGAIGDALGSAVSGTVTEVDCGQFVKRRRRKPSV